MRAPGSPIVFGSVLKLDLDPVSGSGYLEIFTKVGTDTRSGLKFQIWSEPDETAKKKMIRDQAGSGLKTHPVLKQLYAA